MRNSKRFMIALAVLLGIACLASSSYAVSAKKGSFAILGRPVEAVGAEAGIIEEKIGLWTAPGSNNVLQARIISGTEVLILDKAETAAGTFYIVSTFGERGGITGWVSEEYIYKITKESP